MADETFALFETAARERGFDEVLVREWAPRQVHDTHSHPFALKVRVVRGEMWLERGGDSLHVTPRRRLRARCGRAARRALRG